MSNAPKVDPADDLYDRDGYAWSKREADLLRQQRFGEIDLANVIEEIESVGRSEWRALKSSYRVLIQHLLKWQYQAERRSRSWTDTIRTQRTNIESDEEDSPSLKRETRTILTAAYRLARKDAADETGLPLSTFPETCPYTVEQLRDRDFLPE
ncbi:DUF29 domain-containing protein [Jiella avicenniae]|uniref:DUF29 domain-containing protein n=1 Tax=Jiella avicenniae TaxID=2907202 RepID=A0A9X1T2Y2_9HYPH|nr:DUF29 domain-containing protein [Jiella avicenniae]MCE7026786.1 DUF29 domain-containing protein [Jiella avicenniae]